MLAAGCATTSHHPDDPLEAVNRGVFAFNDAVDTYALKPVAQGYQTVTPLPTRTNVSNFFGNVEDVWIGFNNVLQGKAKDGFGDLGRFLINSTIGILGFFDVATELGIEKHEEDFGQTLAVWGVGNGPYLVLPFFGPRTLRDSGGLVLDSVASPISSIDPIPARNTVRGLKLVSDRAQFLGAEQALNEAALDKYAYARNFYLQRRRNQVFDGQPPRLDDESALPGEQPRVGMIGFPDSMSLLLSARNAEGNVEVSNE